MVGIAIACKTRSGTLVGPGICRKWRPVCEAAVFFIDAILDGKTASSVIRCHRRRGDAIPAAALRILPGAPRRPRAREPNATGGANAVEGSGSRANPGERVAVLVEQGADPVDGGAHADGAAQIAVHDDPILGGDLVDRWRQALEQRVVVADKAREDAAPRPGANRRPLHRRVGGAQRDRRAGLAPALLDPARGRVVRLLLGVGYPRLGGRPGAPVHRAGDRAELRDVKVA